MRKRLRIVLPLVLVLVVAIVLLARARSTDTGRLIVSGVVEAREVHVGSKVGGRVTEVPVREGAIAEKGQVLVRFDAAELKAERAQLEARIAQAQADMARLERGYRPEEIAQAEANAGREAAALRALEDGPRPQEIAQAEADLAAAQADAGSAAASYRRMQKLRETGDVSAQVYDDAKARSDQAAKRVEAIRQRVELLRAGTRDEDILAGRERMRQAQANLRMLKSGYRTEEIQAARARVAEAKALLESNGVRLRETEIAAPSRSTIETVSVRPGDVVPAGRTVATLLERSQIWVRAYVPEPDLGRIATGRQAAVEIDTFAGRKFSGVIEQIANQAEFLPRNIQTRSDREHQVFGIKVRVDDPEGVLKPGMAATVEIQ